jgi:hypothetical protein
VRGYLREPPFDCGSSDDLRGAFERRDILERLPTLENGSFLQELDIKGIPECEVDSCAFMTASLFRARLSSGFVARITFSSTIERSMYSPK